MISMIIRKNLLLRQKKKMIQEEMKNWINRVDPTQQEAFVMLISLQKIDKCGVRENWEDQKKRLLAVFLNFVKRVVMIKLMNLKKFRELIALKNVIL